MTVLSDKSIRAYSKRGFLVDPLEPRTTKGFLLTPEHEEIQLSYGLSACGVDVRVKEEALLEPGAFRLFSIVEYITMPPEVVGIVHDKSTLARLGLAVQNTVIEPGWRGYLTVEVTNHSKLVRFVHQRMPIAQILFHHVDQPVDKPYTGKYQDQPGHPVEAK